MSVSSGERSDGHASRWRLSFASSSRCAMESMYFRSTHSRDTLDQRNPSWAARKSGRLEFFQKREIALFDIVEREPVAARAGEPGQTQRGRAHQLGLKQPVELPFAGLTAVRREERLDEALAQHSRQHRGLRHEHGGAAHEAIGGHGWNAAHEIDPIEHAGGTEAANLAR